MKKLLLLLIILLSFNLVTAYDNVVFFPSVGGSSNDLSIDAMDLGETGTDEGTGIVDYFKNVVTTTTISSEGGAGGVGSITEEIITFQLGEDNYSIPVMRKIDINASCEQEETRMVKDEEIYCVDCNGEITTSAEGDFLCTACPEGLLYFNGKCKTDPNFYDKYEPKLVDFLNNKIEPIWEENKFLILLIGSTVLIIIFYNISKNNKFKRRK